MKRSGLYAAHAVLLSVFLIGFSAAQVATGTPALGSFAGGPDIVNLGNLNTHLDIPIVRKAGRGTNFNYDLTYDSSIWKKVTVSGTPTWQPVNTATVAGWQGLIPAGVSYITSTMTSYSSQCGYMGQSSYTDYSWTNFYYFDPFGTRHTMGGSGSFIQGDGSYACPPAGPEPPTVPWLLTASDGSGYSLYIYPSAGSLSGYAVDVHGTTITAPVISNPSNYWGSTSTTDRNGNQITSSNGSYTDTLNTTALTVIGTAPSNTNISYRAPSGSPATYVVSYAAYTEHTNFGCSGIAEYPATSTSLVDKVTLPDGTFYQFSYETTPGDTHNPHYVDGRVSSITLPTGGTISYAYTNGNLTGSAVSNGIVCADGSTAGLTRTVTPGGTSPAGTWTYARTQVSGAHWQTTTTDPTTAQNQSVIDFWADSATYNFYPTQALAYQGSSGGGTLLRTTIICYNNTNPTPSTCPTTAVTTPINNQTVFRYLPAASGQQTKTFISYYQGVAALPTEIDRYNFGSGSVGTLVNKAVTSYSTFAAGAILPTSAVVKDGSNNVLASTTFTYDQGGVTATGATQHVSVGSSRGNLTTIATQVNSTQTLYQYFDYYDTGMGQDAYDYSLSATTHGSKTSYVYDNSGTPPKACDYAFPTRVNLPNGLSRSMTWNCMGGVATQVTDENGSNVTSSYTDAEFWRPATVIDQLSNQTNLTYIRQNGQTAVEASLQTFNGGNSVSDFRTTVDGFGRPILTQRLQGPGATNYDTVETDYDNLGRPFRSTMPFSASVGTTNSTAPGTNATYDAIGRVLTFTDANGGTVSYTYTNNDVLQSFSGTQTFNKQLEYDGLGRLTSVCEISSTLPGVGPCGQSNPRTGLWTKYTYDALGHLLNVTQNAQAAGGSQQTRSFVYDMLGRVTSESNPEAGNSGTNGTITYVWDSISPCGDGTNHVFPGDLVQKKDNAGNITCYSYDALHRIVTAGNTSVTNTILRQFFYDSKSSYPTGVTVSNGNTHMVEAKTVNTSNVGAFVTDEFFSYSRRGEVVDVYEATPHSGSGVYYHTTASYWPTGALKSLSGIPSVPTINYGANGAGLDGEGRYTQVTAASGTNPVSSVVYSTSAASNPLGALTGVTFGSADSDGFTYDPKTGRMATYTYSVNGKTDVGTLTWNTNGTLQKLAIVDQIPGTADSQTCYHQYDDLRRLSSTTCGSTWTQNFTYDSFGNITKSGSSAFAPIYSSTTNQFTSLPGVSVKYDANGKLLTDNLNSYTWDPNWGNMLTVSNGSTMVTATYDALGRMVENNAGGAYTEFIYAPTGAKVASTHGTTLVQALIGLPGGAKAVYNSSGLAYYRHSDWLGSSRLTSTTTLPTAAYSMAYAPFGEQYGKSGTADASFTGHDPSTVSSLYDFTFRESSPSQGRWISPDPAGRGAVTLANPQSWNQYAYVLNGPLSFTDPGGLYTLPSQADDDGGGGGGLGGGCGYGAPPGTCGVGGGGGGVQGLGGTGGGGGGGSPDGKKEPCVGIGAGIDTNMDNSFLNTYSSATGAAVAFPYDSSVVGVSGSPVADGLASVATQASGISNGSTDVMVNFVNNLTSANSDVILVLFSGSAQAFATGVSSGQISQRSLKNVSQIVYVSPGAPGGLAITNIPTSMYIGNLLNGEEAAVVGSTISGDPVAFGAAGVPTGISDCGHSLSCDINSGQIDPSNLPSSSNCNSANTTGKNEEPASVPAEESSSYDGAVAEVWVVPFVGNVGDGAAEWQIFADWSVD